MISGNVLLTGGSGTLGHAIVRNAQKFGWDTKFTIYSRSELQQARMRAKYPNCRYVLGDVRDYARLSATIAGHEFVIHAAANKRIPEAEIHPTECYLTNVAGSENVVRACIEARVRRCVAISTDKACKAITAYGASKLMMEKMFQAQSDSDTIFTLVRYGNVVASNGSVVPIWRDQYKRGEPITVTDVRCTRFWMSEDDAVDLIERAFFNPPGSILVPKMRSLEIVELAKLLAPDGEIKETGFRSVEKLHEDLIHTDEKVTILKQHFLVGYGSKGVSYTSQIAERMTPEEYMEILERVEAHE